MVSQPQLHNATKLQLYSINTVTNVNHDY